MDPRRLVTALAAAGLLVLLTAGPAFAAPQRLSADPEPGAELHEPPERIEITFSEPLDEASGIRVFDDCERRIDDRSTEVSLNEMTVGIAKPVTGTYTVAYVAVGLSGTAREAYAFEVLHGAKACDGGSGGHGGNGGHDGGDDGGGGGGGGGHDDHDGGGGGGGHDDHGGDTASGGHGAHDATAGDARHGKQGKHGKQGRAGHDKKRGKQGGRGRHGGPGSDNPPLATGAVPGAPQPDGTAVLGGLGVALLLGVLGGWVLRVAGPS